MKAQFKKYLAIGAIVCTLPFAGFAQYDNSMQPADAGDTVVSPADQQLDSAEAQQVAPPDQAPVSTQAFYNDLSPYGQWVNMPDYGYVWIPSAGPGFVPYSNYGHWVYTEYGWTWVSDYSWGWAPFHYGRWEYDGNYGWFWIPDTEWGPAWVCWRHCDGYYGWAPLGWHMNIRAGYYGDYGLAASRWMFVGEGHIGDRNISKFYVSRANSEYLYSHSTVVGVTHFDSRHNVTYAAGPRAEDVAKVTHAPVRQIAVRPTVAPEQRYDNAHLHIYKPDVRPVGNSEPRPAPTRAINVNQVPKRSDYTQSYRSAPAPQQRSAPAPQQRSYSAPQQHYSAPAMHSAPAGGGGRGGRR